MGQLTQTTTELQAIVDNSDAANVGKTSLTDGSDTTAVAFKKSGFYSLQGSSSNAPSTDRAVLISAIRDTAATGEIRYGQIAITESNGLWWNRDDGGSLGTWYAAVSTTGTQTLTNKTLTSPVLTTPQINDSAADHQYIFAGSNLVADRTVTLPLLASDDTFVFAAHTQTLTNKTLTTPTVSGLTLSDASIIFEGATADAHETTLTVSDPTADRTITLPDATDTLVGLATTDTLTNKTLTSPVLNTGVSGTAVLNADDFTGASATTLATSESIKAYVDAQVGTVDTLAEVLANGNATDGTNVVVTAGDVITTDTISETTAAAGVTIDGVLLKDDGVNATNLEVTNIKANDGTAAVSIADSTGVMTIASSVLTTADINAGTIDGTVIGGTTAAAITGTAITATGIMTATGTSVFASLDISGDIDVDGTTNLDVVDIDGAVDFASTTAHAGNATFADNAKAIFGAGSDLQIYHDGSNSYISDAGTGDLILRGSNGIELKSTIENETLAYFARNGAAALYYDNALKLATTATGIDVTGTVTADGLTVDGDASVAGTTGATVDTGTITTGKDSVSTRTHWRMNNPNGEVAKWDSNGTDLLHFITDEYKVYTAGNKAFEIDGNGDISFYEDTGTTPKLVWKSADERLGIGTSSPSSSLEVVGGAALGSGFTQSRSGHPTFGINSGGTDSVYFSLAPDGGSHQTFMQVRDDDTDVDSVAFSTSGTERMRIDSVGQVRLGNSTPTWDATFSSLVTKGGFLSSQNTSYLYSGQNAYFNGGFKYSADGYATLYEQSFGAHTFYGAASGVANNAISYIPRLTISNTGAATFSGNVTASGNLLVGTTNVDPAGANVAGTAIGSTGYISMSRSSGAVGIFNRKTNDGNILEFNKDGTNVGSIGATSGRLYIGDGDVALRFADDLDFIAPWNASTNAARDNAISLGNSGNRFKDLYLSGGVYLGGTGAANKLDDYEEGTWTPALGGTWTTDPTALSGIYTKVGNVVTIRMKMTGGVKSSAVSGYITGLPFATNNSYGSVGSVSNTGVADFGNCLFQNTDRIWLTETNLGTGGIWISGVYETTA